MAEYLEKTAVIKAIHDEIYSGGKWSGGWYERPEEQAEKNFTKRINAITPEKVIDMSVIEKIMAEIIQYFSQNRDSEDLFLAGCSDGAYHALAIIDEAVKEYTHETR